MRRIQLIVALLASLGVLVAASLPAAAASTAPLTTAQVMTRFKAATGATLAVDKGYSYAGHYTALALPPSMSNQAKYGRFMLYVVDAGNAAGEIEKLLADGHTGALGAPGAAGIHWESGRYLNGGTFWLAKKQYGANLVLWWYGTEKKVNASFTRLHKPLLTRVAAP